jgi:hypothetical protein
MHSMHTTTSKVENAAQVLSSLQKFVRALNLKLSRTNSVAYSASQRDE